MQTIAEATARLIAFMGKTHGCEVVSKEVFKGKDTVCREVTWKKDTMRFGELEHTFFIYETMRNVGEQTELLKSAQRKLQMIFG